MHDCLNTPPCSKCHQPPNFVRHAKVFPSIGYLNRSTACGNLRLGKADTGKTTVMLSVWRVAP